MSVNPFDRSAPSALPPDAQALALALPPGDDLWVFAYGSLMWAPGFPFVTRCTALLRGYHRRFCIHSTHHRGTPECPGLVFGLDHGGACRGVAYRVAARDIAPVLAYLWHREMVSNVYRPKMMTVRLDGGDAVSACAFVVDRSHSQYCPVRDRAEAVSLIRQGVGRSGRNIDYLANTVQHLRDLGLRDQGLEALLEAATSDEG